jgi:ribonucleoside-diphosphate reductase alpha chain
LDRFIKHLNIMSIQIDTSKWVKGKNYPEWLDEIGISMVSKGYLLPDEDMFRAFNRVSKAAARRLRRKDLQPFFFEAMVKNWLCLASPVLSNLGTERGMPISCFGIDVGDSIEGIADANSELMRLSSQGGGVGIGLSRIRGRGKSIKDNGISEGVVPWAKIYDSTIIATNQGSVRRGAASVNLNINHQDIEEFLMIRRPKGDVNRQCLNLHQCVVIDDEFMQKLEDKDPKALRLWGEILKTRLETGEPYIMFEDNVNNNNPEAYKKNNLKVSMTNICSEISLYTDELHSFICCLSSLNLARWDEWKDYKFENGMTLPELTCWFLEGVLQEFIDRAKNIKFMENTVRSAIKGRAIGIGVLGWHTYLQSKGLPFVGIQASAQTRIISEFIHTEALKASRAQAEQYGEPEWCKGTGLRHTHHLAIAPTVSNAHISGGVSPSIEPIPANVYNLKTAKGVFIKKNPILEKLLEEKGYNIESVWSQILKDQGSVYGLPDYILSDEEKEIFKTFKEINQLEIVRQNAIRQKYVDQAISLNLCFDPNDTPKWISQVHKEAHNLGIKTLYYLRTESVLRGDNLDRLADCVACES